MQSWSRLKLEIVSDMAYDFKTASSQFVSTGSTPLIGTPVTIACNFYRKTNTSGNVLFAIDNGTNAATGITVMSLPSASNVLLATSNDGSGPRSAQTTATYQLNTWNHACGVFSNTSNRTVYLNGGNNVTNTVTSNVTNQSNISIGARYIGGVVGLFADILIAEVGIWNVALTAAEVASLADGMTCDKVRPQSLVFYAPLVRDLQDVRGGLTITNNNGATVANHPRVYV
jgi:hypothetical protein